MEPVPGASLPLRELADRRRLLVGAAVAIGPLLADQDYRRVLAREYNCLVPENHLKWGPLRPAPDRFDFAAADAMVDFAHAHRMQVRGQTLVWHNAVPAWLTGGSYGRTDLERLLQEHIQAVVGRYRGRIFAWDVVNEAVAERGGLRETIWSRALGPRYLDLAFRWAHEADPQARLFLNDFGAEGLGAKAAGVYRLAQQLLEREVPLHGIGLQMHVGLGRYPAPEEVAANINRLAALGLEVHVTEMDVRIQDGKGTREERLAAQARVYGDLLAACLPASGFRALLTWGFTDRHSWIPWHTGRPDAALPFDESYQPKPAYFALARVLEG